ncbi:MAG: DUF5335 family protein [Capsulimonadales bacterium]|nr:DUF5335 family protein [Capsulimonadales bacterium]
MATQALPPEEWSAFFDDFTRKHRGKPASIQLYGPGTMGRAEAKRLPFAGVAFEKKGSDAGAVRVMLGDTAESHLTHEIPGVNRVWSRPAAEDSGVLLEIHGAGDQTLILHLHSPSS